MKSMIKAIIPLFTILMLFTSYSCNKKDDCSSAQQYTVKGKIVNGTTGKPLANHFIGMETDYNYNSTTKLSQRSYYRSSTDSSGNFIFMYNCLKGSGNVFVYLNDTTGPDNDCMPSSINDVFFVDNSNNNAHNLLGFPASQNINGTWTASINGWLKIYVNTSNPLKSGDTLYIQLSQLDPKVNMYKITTQPNGLYDSIYIHNGCYDLKWGRGLEDFRHGVHVGSPSTVNIIGDPYVSNFTLNY